MDEAHNPDVIITEAGWPQDEGGGPETAPSAMAPAALRNETHQGTKRAQSSSAAMSRSVHRWLLRYASQGLGAPGKVHRPAFLLAGGSDGTG